MFPYEVMAVDCLLVVHGENNVKNVKFVSEEENQPIEAEDNSKNKFGEPILQQLESHAWGQNPKRGVCYTFAYGWLEVL